VKEFILTHKDKIDQPGQCHLVYERPNGGGYVGSIEPQGEGGYLASFDFPIIRTNKVTTVEEAFEWLKTQALK
jgi:hypothetical protein